MAKKDRRILKEKLDGKPIAMKAWKQEYAQLKTEYAELSPHSKSGDREG